MDFQSYRQFSRNQGSRGLWNTIGNVAQSSSRDAHLFAFVTSNKGAVMGGWAPVGALCRGQKKDRTSISRYNKGKVTWTSEVPKCLNPKHFEGFFNIW